MFPRPMLVIVLAHLLSSSAAEETRALTLQDAVQIAVGQNLDLLQERLLARRASALETAAWSAFTPELNVRAGVDDRRALVGENAGLFADSSVGVAWSAPTGTQIAADLILLREMKGPASASTGALVLSMRQPLLRNAWFTGAALPLETASIEANIAREALRAEVDAFIVDVENAYWELALAQADVTIKTRSRDRAKQQHEDTAENIRRGILADVEIYLVEENLVFFEGELVRAIENRAQARRRLAQLLWREPDARIEAAQGLEMLGGIEGVDGESIAGAAARATERSPFLAEQRLRVELARARERSTAMNSLPRLDLDGSVSLLGNGLDATSPAVDRVFLSPTPEMRVGLTFSVPLGPPPLRANVQASSLLTEREKLELSSRELFVRHDVERGVGQLVLNLKLEKLSRKQLELAELKLSAQQEKYRNGISTLADVVRFQRELDDASIALRRTVRDVHLSRARLLQREGRLADSFGIQVGIQDAP